ncbi:hypothetical protein C4573_02055 [Candidatus Woesearchaeota archaeon]|nr:MAG: hypothetical protein C4573_02055 [Candidatus Woesearchaeota archaeon]
MKKAFIFTLDAFLASVLLVGGFFLISNLSVQKSGSENIDFIARDVLQSLSVLRIYEIKDSNAFVQSEIGNGNITNFNNTIISQIGEYWATYKLDKAKQLADSVLKDVVPDRYGFNLSMGGDTIFYKPKTDFKEKINSRRMISGIELGKPIVGSSSDAFLKRIRDKPSSVYLYFGGFVGQGNITGNLFIPPISQVTKLALELDVESSFQLKINGDVCNNATGGTYFVPVTANMTSDYWDITADCNSSLISGNNNFTFLFDNVNTGYIGGGYVKVSYQTDEFQELDYGENKSRYYFPGILGIVNLYDSFYVPGEVQNISIYLHYLANHTLSNNTFYLTIGNTTVYRDNSSTVVMTVALNESNYSALLSEYSKFNKSTVPVRAGFENVTFKQILTGGEGFGDIALTTDVSGSMDWRFDNTNAGTVRACDSPDLYNVSTQRLSVAKCLDKIFVDSILENTTLNRIGLVSYTSTTDSVLSLTNTEQFLTTEIDTYNPLSATCISCGIADSYNLLIAPPPAQLHTDLWKYSTDYQFLDPPSGWNDLGFDDANWSQGYTISGFGGLESTTTGSFSVAANLWQRYDDNPDTPADFNSGVLNTTANTFGLGAGDDGWDTLAGNIYGGNSSLVTINNLVNMGFGDYELRITIDGTSSLQTSAGAYGIEFNVTQEMIDTLATGGRAVVSFDYRWDDRGTFQTADQVWIKARITNASGSYYLGSNLDAGHQGADADLEVYTDNDPDGDYASTFSTDVTGYFSQSGMHYLDFGGKILRNENDEDGRFNFDNVQVVFINKTGNITYRNTFNIQGKSRLSDMRLYVYSDDGAEVYLNGNLISSDPGPHAAAYWNVNGISVDMNFLNEGENVLAARVFNNDNVRSYFDLELRANMTDRQKAMVIMSDGDANRCIADWTAADSGCDNCGGRACCPNASGSFNQQCPNLPTLGGSADGDERALEQVVNLSCYLNDYHNISVFTVAFGLGISENGTKALNLSAACDNSSHFYTSNNISGLADLYQDIADSILTGFGSVKSQIIVTSGGGFDVSNLYPDSYIEYSYKPLIETPDKNEISIVAESDKFSSCNASIDIPSGIRVIDAKVISYSGEHWTDYAAFNGQQVFNLSLYDNASYLRLGDPFLVQIPSDLFVSGMLNNISLKTGDDWITNTNCSTNNSLIYTMLVNSSTGRTDLLPSKEGCNWTVESEDMVNNTYIIPLAYNGTKTCSYTNASITYDPDSTYDVAVYKLFQQLDFDSDGRILMNLEQEDLEIKLILVSGLPYQWGPSLIEANIWQ